MAAGPGKNAFHRRWPMTWTACRPTGAKRRRRRRPSRRAAATDVTPISGPPAHGRAFAALPAGSGLIAGSPEDKRPKISRSFQAAPRNRECRVEAGAGAAMNWPLYTKATAAAADYEAALERTFGAASGEARADSARNGSQPDHPLHPLYVAKNESADSWAAEAKNSTAAAA